MRIQKDYFCPQCGAYLFTDTKASKICWKVTCKACGQRNTFDSENEKIVKDYKPERITSAGARFY